MWTMTHTPPPRNWHLLQNDILGPDALHNANNDRIWKYTRIPIALSTLSLMLPMIWNGSGGCLARYLGCTSLWWWSSCIITPSNHRALCLRLPAWGGRCASFSLCALHVADSLPALSRSGLWDMSAQHFKKQKINDLFYTDIVSFLTIQQQQQFNFGSVI